MTFSIHGLFGLIVCNIISCWGRVTRLFPPTKLASSSWHKIVDAKQDSEPLPNQTISLHHGQGGQGNQDDLASLLEGGCHVVHLCIQCVLLLWRASCIPALTSIKICLQRGVIAPCFTSQATKRLLPWMFAYYFSREKKIITRMYILFIINWLLS